MTKKIIYFLPVLLIFISFSCNRFKEKTKEVINKGGETAGKSAAEFFEGVSEGVDRTLQCETELSQNLKNKGIKTGKFSISNDTVGGENNVLTLYMIFEKDFNDFITLKAFDKTGKEFGRVKVKIGSKAGDAQFYDFQFDKRSYIEVRSKILIE